MATINGTPVNFGFSTAAGITVTGLDGILLQSAEHSKAADLEQVRDGKGDEVIHAWYNQREEATLEWVIAGTSLAAAITNTTTAVVTPGTIISITGCPQIPALVATTWEVQSGAKVSGSNVGAKRATLPLTKFAGITAAAT